jgi:hypothetical protein
MFSKAYFSDAHCYPHPTLRPTPKQAAAASTMTKSEAAANETKRAEFYADAPRLVHVKLRAGGLLVPMDVAHQTCQPFGFLAGDIGACCRV